MFWNIVTKFCIIDKPEPALLGFWIDPKKTCEQEYNLTQHTKVDKLTDKDSSNNKYE